MDAQTTSPAATDSTCETACCGSSCAQAPEIASMPAGPTDSATRRYRIATMDCATEESEIRRALEPIGEIKSLRFDLGERVMSIVADPAALDTTLAAIRKIGFTPQLLDVAVPGATGGSGHVETAPLKSELPKLLLALLMALVAEGLFFLAADGLMLKLAEMLFAGTAIALSGFSTYKKGLAALRSGRLNINALMAVAVTGAFLIGQWPEAGMVMALYSIAELIEARAVDRARNAIQSLLEMAPEHAEVQQADGSWERQLVAVVPVGALVRLRPGERVPLDGVLISGTGSVDQAPLTGESIPVDKAAGDELYAGTINQTAALEFRVTALASNSTLARIIHAVEQAQGARAPTQRFVDRFAAIYTPAVFLLAIAVALLTPWLAGWSWMLALYKALVLLVIACPCALVISTPVTVVSALAAAARRGVLIKGGVYLEQARKLKAVALDKTGTITAGKPTLVAFQVLDESADSNALATLALSLASRSDHPVSSAIAQGLRAGNFQAAMLNVDDFAAVAGRGVQGQMAGAGYVLANHRWIEERGQCSPAIEGQLREHEKNGRTVTLLASEQGVLALCAVADTIKPSSQQAVVALKALGVTPVMLTGDNQATAEAIAAQAGIAEVRGNLLPEDKLAAIQDLQRRLGPTGMTGDGINDAPALAQADIGFAMGAAGTHTAMEAADVLVMNDDLQRLPETIRLSRRTHAVLWQNITLALGIKAGFLVAAVLGDASMWMAVFADMGASLLVVFNGLRLLKADVSR